MPHIHNAHVVLAVSILLVLTGLVACGGGGDSSTPEPTPLIPKTWRTPTLIETNDGVAESQQIAFDAVGNALAVWHQFDGTRYSIMANRFIAGTGAGNGWGTAELIETDNAGNAFSPQIAINGNGHALAVWSQFDGTRYNIWANRFTAGTGWATAELIETDNAGAAAAPQIAIDANGNALAVWSQHDGTRNNIWANRFIVGTGWGTAALIETDNAGNASAPQIAIDANGNALAVWSQFDATRNNIWANRFIADTGWGTAALIETSAGPAAAPQIAIDANGNALAVWPQFDSTRYNIWANRFVAGTGWGAAELIETDNVGDAADSRIAIDANGNALAVWSQFDGTRYNIWANRFVAGTGWGAAELIETDSTADGAYEPDIAVDANGNAVAVWYQSDGTRDNAAANRYTNGAGWGTAALIENEAGDVGVVRVAVDANGNALAVWDQSDGTRYNLWANRYE